MKENNIPHDKNEIENIQAADDKSKNDINDESPVIDADKDKKPAVDNQTSDENEEAPNGNDDIETDVNIPIRHKKDTRRLRYGGMATALTAVVVAAVILINVVTGILNDRYPLNIDLTPDKIFTLSDESRKIVKNTKKDTKIIVFGEESMFSSPNLQDTNLNKVFKQFHEITKQYDSLSGGRIKTTYVDLISNPTLETKYKEYEPANGDIVFICGNRWQKANVDNLFTFNKEASYYSQQLTDVSSEVEKVITSKIAMVTSEKTPIVTMLTGHEEDEMLLTGIESVIKNNNYEVEKLNIATSAEFNKESTLVVVAAPQSDYSEEEIEKLGKWLNNNGKYNRHLAVIASFKAKCPKLYEFINVEYGIEITDNLITETNSNRMFNYNIYSTLGDIGTSDYSDKIAGKPAFMPVTRQIITHKDNNQNNNIFNVDLVTFPESAKLVKMTDAFDQQEENEKIKQVAAEEYPITGMAYATKWGYSNNEKYETHVFVSGSSQAFFENAMQFNAVENEQLLISMMNGFTGNKNPVTISSKPLEKTKLEFTTGQQNIFFMVFVIAIPIALLIACLVVFVRRRSL